MYVYIYYYIYIYICVYTCHLFLIPGTRPKRGERRAETACRRGSIPGVGGRCTIVDCGMTVLFKVLEEEEEAAGKKVARPFTVYSRHRAQAWRRLAAVAGCRRGSSG